jgi:hypothetical protein
MAHSQVNTVASPECVQLAHRRNQRLRNLLAASWSPSTPQRKAYSLREVAVETAGMPLFAREKAAHQCLVAEVTPLRVGHGAHMLEGLLPENPFEY